MTRQRQQQEDFRRIVGAENGQGLGDPLPRDDIGDRYRVVALSSEGAVFGAFPVDDPDDDGGFDSRNPDFDPESGTIGGSDGIIDNEFVTEVGDEELGLDDIFGGTLSDIIGGIGDKWGGVGAFTAQDCETGACIRVNLDGEFRPPEGWDDLTKDDPYWVQGYWWRNPPNFAPDGDFRGPSHVSVINMLPKTFPPSFGTGYYEKTSNYYQVNINRWDVVYQRYNTDGTPVQNTTLEVSVLRRECEIGGEFFDDFLCSITEPPSQKWPSDDCTQLAQDENGVWRMHPAESDRIAKYEQGTQLGFICSGSSTIQRLDGVNGGSVLWDYMNNKYAYKDPVEGRWKFGSSSSLNQQVSPIVRRDPETGEAGATFIYPVGGLSPAD